MNNNPLKYQRPVIKIAKNTPSEHYLRDIRHFFPNQSKIIRLFLVLKQIVFCIAGIAPTILGPTLLIYTQLAKHNLITTSLFDPTNASTVDGLGVTGFLMFVVFFIPALIGLEGLRFLLSPSNIPAFLREEVEGQNQYFSCQIVSVEKESVYIRLSDEPNEVWSVPKSDLFTASVCVEETSWGCDPY